MAYLSFEFSQSNCQSAWFFLRSYSVILSFLVVSLISSKFLLFMVTNKELLIMGSFY